MSFQPLIMVVVFLAVLGNGSAVSAQRAYERLATNIVQELVPKLENELPLGSKVAVMPFRNRRGGVVASGQEVAAAVEVRLSGVMGRHFELVTRRQLGPLYDEMQFMVQSGNAQVSGHVAVAPVQYLVTGTLQQMALNHYRAQVTVLKFPEGHVVAGLDASGQVERARNSIRPYYLVGGIVCGAAALGLVGAAIWQHSRYDSFKSDYDKLYDEGSERSALEGLYDDASRAASLRDGLLLGAAAGALLSGVGFTLWALSAPSRSRVKPMANGLVVSF